MFERSLLFHEVTGIEVEWMEGYGNSPRIRLLGPVEDHAVRRAWFEAALWKQFPEKGLWLATHPNGFVRYLAHSGLDRNEEGFGGASFHIHREDGTPITLKGPWSSRATCINMVVPPEDWIMDTDQHALRVDAFLALCEEYAFPHFVIRKGTKSAEPKSVQISTSPDCIRKPDGSEVLNYGMGTYEVLYSPK